ncbi:MAG: hypothetical protein L3K25_14545 [Gammaproteobacteria bacterium]|nr:hypothetical protein [Gammaproteobacteria bacterium]
MKNLKINLINLCLSLFILTLIIPPVHAASVLQAFKGSTEKGVYKTQFAEFDFAKSATKQPDIKTVEGKLYSRVLLKPDGKNNLEIFRSYQNTLKKAGFIILHSATPKKSNPKSLIKKLFNDNGLSKRRYRKTGAQVSSSDLDRLRLFGDYYLSAVKQTEKSTLFAVVVLSRERNLYLIDELTAASMEQDTVKLNLDVMKNSIAESGKIAVYDIYFETDSAKITGKSRHALKTIADYLKQDNSNYYTRSD